MIMILSYTCHHRHMEFESENTRGVILLGAPSGMHTTVQQLRNCPFYHSLFIFLNYQQRLSSFWKFNSYVPRCFEKSIFPISSKGMVMGVVFLKFTNRIYSRTRNLLQVSPKINDECFNCCFKVSLYLTGSIAHGLHLFCRHKIYTKRNDGVLKISL